MVNAIENMDEFNPIKYKDLVEYTDLIEYMLSLNEHKMSVYHIKYYFFEM